LVQSGVDSHNNTGIGWTDSNHIYLLSV